MAFGIFSTCVLLVLSSKFFDVCSVSLNEHELVFRYHFRLFDKAFHYPLTEIDSVILSTRDEAPVIRIVFHEHSRCETMFSDGASRAHEHLFNRTALKDIAEALHSRGISAAVE